MVKRSLIRLVIVGAVMGVPTFAGQTQTSDGEKACANSYTGDRHEPWHEKTPCLEGKVREVVERPRDPSLFQNGQGFYVGTGSFILTAAHVLGGCQYFTIIDGSGGERSAGLVLWDARRDVAVLRPESDGLPGQPDRGAGLQLSKPTKGVPIGAVRIAALDVLDPRPGGPSLKSRTASPPNAAPLGPTRSIVLEGEPLDPGASGAPVLNGEGHVVGMVTANVPLNINRETIRILTVATDAAELEGALLQAGGDNNAAPPNITISGREPVQDLTSNVVRIRCR